MLALEAMSLIPCPALRVLGAQHLRCRSQAGGSNEGRTDMGVLSSSHPVQRLCGTQAGTAAQGRSRKRQCLGVQTLSVFTILCHTVRKPKCVACGAERNRGICKGTLLPTLAGSNAWACRHSVHSHRCHTECKSTYAVCSAGQQRRGEEAGGGNAGRANSARVHAAAALPAPESTAPRCTGEQPVILKKDNKERLYSASPPAPRRAVYWHRSVPFTFKVSHSPCFNIAPQLAHGVGLQDIVWYCRAGIKGVIGW